MSNATLLSPSRKQSFTPRPKRAGWVAPALLLLGVFGAAAYTKIGRREAAVSFSENAAGGKPLVNTTLVSSAPPIAELVLPGNTEAVVVADIYARATGYVKVRSANMCRRA